MWCLGVGLSTGRRSRRIARLVLTAVLAGSALSPSGADALPSGRAWTPIDTLRIHGHPYMAAERLDTDSADDLRLIVTGQYGPGDGAYGMKWADSAWVETWSGILDNYIMWPTSSPRDERMLVWKTTVPPVGRRSHLVTATAFGDSISAPDTVAVCDVEAFMYTGAVWGDTRWVAVRDLDNTTLGFPFHLRVYRSRASEPWTLVRDEHLGFFGVRGIAMRALDSTRVLIVTANPDFRVHWGVLADTNWSVSNSALSAQALVNSPQFRANPDRSDWLVWAQGDRGIYANRLSGEAWVQTDTLLSAFPDGLRWNFFQPYVSKDSHPYPAVAWHGFSDAKLIDHVWVAFPNDSGFGIGEKLDGTAFGYLPQVARDENGDVWVAFSRDLAGAFWLHTHATATTSVPEVVELGGRPLVRWSLSVPSPETWWAVERAVGSGEFEVAARVRATDEQAMQWHDTTGPMDQPLRYRIRRESKDVRYRWWSEEAAWEVRGPVLRLSRAGAHPATEAIEFEVTGAAAGALTMRLHDLQGRLVLTRPIVAAGTAHDIVRVPLAGTSLRPGLYLLSVRGGDGRKSAGLKVAVVR